MGDIFSSNSTKQSTTNNQVGVQSGQGAAAGVGAQSGQATTAVQGGVAYNLSGSRGSSVNIVSSDMGAIDAARDMARDSAVAFHEAGQLGIAGLEAAQITTGKALAVVNNSTLHLLDVNRDVSIAAGNAIVAGNRASLDFASRVNESSLDFGATALTNNERIANYAIDSARDIANIAISGSNRNTIAALEAVQQTSRGLTDLATDAVHTAQQTALSATPVSPGAYAESTKGQDTGVIIFSVIAIAGLSMITYMTKKN